MHGDGHMRPPPPRRGPVDVVNNILAHRAANLMLTISSSVTALHFG
jgi:hypothetical protein